MQDNAQKMKKQQNKMFTIEVSYYFLGIYYPLRSIPVTADFVSQHIVMFSPQHRERTCGRSVLRDA